MANYISQIQVGNTTYEIKDSVARDLALKYILSTNAATTPEGVTWDDEGTTITGTLVASAQTKGIYLVPSTTAVGKNVYDEYVTVTHDGATPTYSWEKLGSTEVSLTGLVTEVTLSKGSGDQVLGEATTFTNAASSVTFTGGTTDTFVKSYPGATSKLVKGSITGVNGSASVIGIKTNTAVTASKVTAATSKTASKVTTAIATATNTTLGTAKTASKATAGTAKNVATTDTAVSFNAFGSALTDVVYNMTVSNETLSFSTASTTSKSITPAKANGTITPYTFTDVSVPNITANDTVSFNAVDTATDVTITQFTAEDVEASKVVSESAVTLAKPAASASTFATGDLSATGTGDSVMTGLGTATTGSAVTGVGTGTAAAQTITVGTNDKVKVAKYDDLKVNVTKHD